MSKPRDQKTDENYMIQYENCSFPATDSRTLQKLMWDKRIENERKIKTDSRVS